MKNKKAISVVNAFKHIFESTYRRPFRVQADKGREFVNTSLRNFFKQNGICFNTTNNEGKCAIAERCIKTLKARIFKYMYHKNSYRYIDVLQAICSSYNNCFHRTIQMAPSAVNDSNILEVYNNLKRGKIISHSRAKCKVNDYVRIAKYKGTFDKGYMPNWSSEIFRIKSVISSSPVVYKIIDLLDEDIEGNFYEQEIQKVIYDEQALTAVDKIVAKRVVGNSTQLLIKWRGYPKKFNSWIDSCLLITQ